MKRVHTHPLSLSIAIAALLGLYLSSGAVPRKGQPPYHQQQALGAVHLDWLQSNRSALSPEFDVGRVSVRGIDLAAWSRPYDSLASAKPGAPLVLSVWTPDRPPSGEPLDTWRGFAEQVRALLADVPLEPGRDVLVRATSTSGMPDDTVAGVLLSPERVQAIVSPPPPSPSTPSPKRPPSVRPRKGGMVWLAGGKVAFRTSADALADARLDVCGDRYCLRFATAADNPARIGETLELPDFFAPGALFARTWLLAHDRGVDAFYLSINPTRATLTDDDPGTAPTDRLRFADAGAGPLANEIVTAGGIDGTELGPIFLAADVAFKAEALGFDVVKGRARARVVQDSELPDPLGPDRPVSSTRWCRLAWQSNDQTIALAGNRLVWSGPSIRAEAEPMRLVNGDLEPYPAGRWCGTARRVAARLNKKLATGKARDAVASLDQIGSFQSFALWARRNHVKTTAAFDASVSSHLSTLPVAPLPRWTSGIRDRTQPVFQRDYRRGQDGRMRRLLVVWAEPAELARMMPDLKTLNTALLSSACDDATSSRCDSRKFEQGLRQAEQTLVARYRGRALPVRPDPVATKDLEFEGGFDLVPLSVTTHGGVLLRALSAEAAQRATLDETLLDPEGRPLFRTDATGGLHFWSFAQPGWNAAAGAGEHLELRGATVVARHADGGTMRFVVEGAGLHARHEVRFPETDELPVAEWTRVVARGGVSVDDGHLVWVDPSAAVPTFVHARLTTAELTAAGTEPVGELALRLRPLGGALWLVEVALPLAPLEAALEARHAAAVQASDLDALGTVIRDARGWGVHDRADLWRDELAARMSASAAVDTLYRDALTDGRLFASLLGFFVDEELASLEATEPKVAKDAAARLARAAVLVTRLPPAEAVPRHARIATALRRLADATRARRRAASLRAQANAQDRQAAIARALQ